jgi:2-polyprenyl-6-methoxyphenol hydroxylase-like FAD-dependent oxidoreductase
VNIQNLKVAVIDCSIGGLSATNVLNRLGFEVTVFEGFSEGFQNRGGALGSVNIQLLQTILPTGTIQKRIRNHGHFYGDLWKYLYDSPLLVPLAKKSYTRVLELKLRQYEFM